MIKATGASLHWSIEDPRELEEQVPGLTLAAELAIYDPMQTARFSWPARLAIHVFYAVPAFGRIGRLLRYRFG